MIHPSITRPQCRHPDRRLQPFRSSACRVGLPHAHSTTAPRGCESGVVEGVCLPYLSAIHCVLVTEGVGAQNARPCTDLARTAEHGRGWSEMVSSSGDPGKLSYSHSFTQNAWRDLSTESFFPLHRRAHHSPHRSPYTGLRHFGCPPVLGWVNFASKLWKFPPRIRRRLTHVSRLMDMIHLLPIT